MNANKAAPFGGPSSVVQANFPGGKLPACWTAQPRLPPSRSGAARPAPRSTAPTAQRAPAVHAFRPAPGVLDGPFRTSGMPIPDSIRHKMEAFFQTDFSQVRVHQGPEAARLGALAFTLGTEIYFAPGQYQPYTQRGQELLGHELTHVVQQRAGRVGNPFGSGVAVVHDEALEREADEMGQRAARSQPPRHRPAMHAPPSVQRASAAPRGGGYRLIIGAYLHPREGVPLPEPLAGHSFVAIENPDGTRRAFGFSPEGYGRYNPHHDTPRLRSGVKGVIHDDEQALSQPGVKTRSFTISESQARAALDRVAEYQSGKYRYSLQGRQCSAFVLDVARAAQVEDVLGSGAQHPRELYRKL